MTRYLFISKLFILFFIASLVSARISAAPAKDSIAIKTRPYVRKFFIGTALDAGIFSSAIIQRNSTFRGTPIVPATTTYGTLRFSYIINFGLTFNFNFGRHFGVYTGVDLKNIGFIEKPYNNETIKQRTYNVGAPIGIKIGNMADKREYFFFGGGADVPFNYKEKSFVIRNQKTKYNEWFSNATPAIMPYVFAGFAIPHGISFKFQYYPNNYVNPDYSHKNNGVYVNEGTTVHLMLLSIGFTAPFGKNPDIIKKKVADLKTSTM